MVAKPSIKSISIWEVRRRSFEARQTACKAAQGMTLEEARKQQETLPEFRERAEQRRKDSAALAKKTD